MKRSKTIKSRNGKVRGRVFQGKNRRDRIEGSEDLNKIIRYGRVVYNVFWDSGAPGPGAEYEYVYKWRDRYAVKLSFDEPMGPYNSLSAAVRAADLNFVTQATVSISSSELTAEQIAKILRCGHEPPFALSINNETWSLNKDKKSVRNAG